ncbi:MAG: fluoride efflux transporter FluC [Planctomycetota bacterium]
MNALATALALAAAGALGTLARAGLTEFVGRLLGTRFPWGTLAVNVVGAAAFGAIVGLSRGRLALPPGMETVLLVGLLGGFTTFSSYAFQTVELIENGRLDAALVYALASNALGVVAVWIGLRLAR